MLKTVYLSDQLIFKQLLTSRSNFCAEKIECFFEIELTLFFLKQNLTL